MLVRSILLTLVLFTATYAQPTKEVIDLAKSLNLYPGTKASIQWERVFSSQKKLQRYGLDILDKEEQEALKAYLIQFSADSDQPIVPGL